MKQGTTLIATGNFSLRKARASRALNVKIGDKFWVTSSVTSNASGIIRFDKEGRGHISCGYVMKIENVLANFAVAE
jgi:hypothetical protein